MGKGGQRKGGGESPMSPIELAMLGVAEDEQAVTPVVEVARESAAEAVINEAVSEAKTLYEVLSSPEFWKQTALRAMGETEEARLAVIQHTVDSYMQGTLSWKDIKKSILPSAQKAFFTELEKARFQAVEARRANDLEVLSKAQAALNAEPAKSVKLEKAPAKPKKSKKKATVKPEKSAEAQPEEPEFYTLYNDLKTYRYWKRRDEAGEIIEPEQFEKCIDGLGQEVCTKEEMIHMLRPEMVDEFFKKFEILVAAARREEAAELREPQGRQIAEAPAEITEETVEIEHPLDALYADKFNHLKGMLVEADQLLATDAPPRGKLTRMLDAMDSVLKAARSSYVKDAGRPLPKTLTETADFLKRRIEVAQDRVFYLPDLERTDPGVIQAHQEVAVNRPLTTPELPPVREKKPGRRKASPVPVVEEEILEPVKIEKMAEVRAPRKTRKGDRTPKRPEMIPEHLLREGVIAPEAPDLTKIIIPPAERLERKEPGYGERLRHGLSYIWNRGNVAVEESVAYHIRGEKTAEELGEREHTKFGIASSLTASLARTAMSYGGVAVAPDFLRYLTQSHYTSKEREALREAISAHVKERQRVDKEDDGYDALREKSQRMAERIEASRYLSKEDKARVLARVREVVATHEERREKTNADFNRAIARIVDDAVVNRVTGTQLAREAGNTALVLAGGPLAITGAHLLRAPVYGGFALVERYQQVSRESAVDASAKEKVRKLMIDGFTGFTSDLTFRTGSNKRERAYNGLMAIGKVVRAGAMAYASTSGLWEQMPTIDTMTAQDLHERIDDAMKAYSGQDGAHVLGELAEHGQVPPEGLGESAMGETLGESLVTESLPSAQVDVLTGEIQMIELPAGFEAGLVKSGDGITQALARVIEHNPKFYGYDGPDDELSIDLFARKLAGRMAKEDGLLRTWLSDQSKGNIMVVPISENGGWHVGFVDAKTHEQIMPEEIKNFTKPQPRR